MTVKEEAGKGDSQRGEVLVAIMNNKTDFAILRDQGWYRIPVRSAPKSGLPEWLAFYQTRIFDDEAYAVNYFGKVRDIEIVPRHKLFPNEIPSTKSDQLYHQIHLESLETLPQPIFSRRWRFIVFIPTTWAKFTTAAEINDLYDESPLEDRLWAEFKRLQVAAERQWSVKTSDRWYFLDFALLCVDGRIDVETDGNRWHADPKRIPEDNRRDNALQSLGWRILRFNGKQIRESMTDYCIPEIMQAVNRVGGLSDEGLVPRKFINLPEGVAQQLTILEEPSDYDPD